MDETCALWLKFLCTLKAVSYSISIKLRGNLEELIKSGLHKISNAQANVPSHVRPRCQLIMRQNLFI